MASIHANPDFNAEELAQGLRKAMKGFGTNEKKIIEILTSCNNEQRQVLKKQFKTMYGRDLIDDLKSELGGNFEDAVIAFMMPPDEYDAHCLRHAMKGAGTDEKVIAEVLAMRSNDQIAAIREAYHRVYDRDLEKDVMSETSGHLKRIFVSLLQGNRDESEDVDEDRAQADAQALYDAGEAKWGTDESEFMTSGIGQLRAVAEKYHTLVRAVEKEMSGDLEFAFKAVLLSAVDQPAFYAERLYKSMKGMGTDDETLIRCVVSRAETDMEQIKSQFVDKYGKKLVKMIKDDTGGDYERFLVAIVGE
ncbi:annexin A7 [Salpingoeca rosetta]|uniref:Annexin n=1 Tax=Salpingoeca rosetta (strain ATCC 50818 / BSB-021) TaxID=946362 RepID=F2UBS2_SALR5|nr:annexin A7 [Salpingoeca rosetta]EGD73938.1 annexin A7 [Salpingoeca rosetta]|eukprot:XP_004993501.1 annexin A7 [Salpingoeca rosetta]